jgi:hypothetical protein
VTGVFADSSALVKLYADEPDCGRIRSMSAFAVSQLARVEIPSALWRKHRLGELSTSDTQVLVAAFEADYHGTDDEPERFLVIGLTVRVLEDAARLVGVHRLRAYDAVQLASACAMHAEIPDGVVFAAYDTALCAAAAAEGLSLLPD